MALYSYCVLTSDPSRKSSAFAVGSSARRKPRSGTPSGQPYIVMALHSYGPIKLWPYIVMALYSYGPI